MPILQAFNLSKSYHENVIFEDVSFQLEVQERIGLVGVNGCGKTTLLRILAGLESADHGSVQLEKGRISGLLRQNPDAEEDAAAVIESGYDPDLAASLNQVGLDLDPVTRPVVLSGGEKTRLGLGRFLSAGFDLLLLDEPTNNMDEDGIHRTLRQLKQHSGSMIIVSHDRYFLDQLVTRVMELERGKIQVYTGNYSAYRLEKEKRFQEQMHRYHEDRKSQRQIEQAIRQTRQWADKAHRNSTKKDDSGLRMGIKEYKRSKAKKMDQKVKNDLRRLERQKARSENKPKAEKGVAFELQQAGRRGRRVLEAENLSKSYADRVLFQESFFYLQDREKVALFGPNGCGKTTLIRLLQQREMPDEGRLWLSESRSPYYLSQDIDDLPADQTLAQFIHSLGLRLDGRVRQTLDQLGFSQHQLSLGLDRFSLGERMKIKLLEPILTPKDFLILDEPTNYLDLPARETLEEALLLYDGTLLIASHDLYLLQRVCDKVFSFTKGQIRRSEDSFERYLQKRQEGIPDPQSILRQLEGDDPIDIPAQDKMEYFEYDES